MLDELVRPRGTHVKRYENNRIEADHGRLKHRLRTDRTAQVIIAGLAFARTFGGHYELATEAPRKCQFRVVAAFTELASAI